MIKSVLIILLTGLQVHLYAQSSIEITEGAGISVSFDAGLCADEKIGEQYLSGDGSWCGIFLPRVVTTSGNLPGGTYEGLTIDGDGITATMTGDITIAGPFNLMEGNLAINGNTLTLEGEVNFGGDQAKLSNYNVAMGVRHAVRNMENYDEENYEVFTDRSTGGKLIGSPESSLTITETATINGALLFSNASNASRSLNNFTSGANITMGSRLHVMGNLTLTDGTFSLGANRLELSGELVMTGGTLNGGGTGRISVYGEEEAALELPAINLNMLDVDREGGVDLTGAVTVQTRVVLYRGTVLNSSNLTMPGTQKRVVVYAGSFDSSPNIVLPDLVYYGDSEYNTNFEIPGDNNIYRLFVYNQGGVSLSSDLLMTNSLVLDSGNLDINGRTIDLTTKYAILRENNGNTITGTSGLIKTKRTYNNVVNFDHHNIGLRVTVGANLKDTEVNRGFEPLDVFGTPSIFRYYEIIPGARTTNQSLNATLIFSYTHGELNGNEEESLKLFGRNANNQPWVLLPNQILDEENNTITSTGVTQIPRYITASSSGDEGPASLGLMPGEITPEETLPEEYGIDQNYPNPFNPTTTIKYQMPENGTVSLKVFDMTGREVMNLVNGFKNAGFHTAQFDGNNLASGVYFYRLDIKGETQEFSRIMRMMLVK